MANTDIRFLARATLADEWVLVHLYQQKTIYHWNVIFPQFSCFLVQRTPIHLN